MDSRGIEENSHACMDVWQMPGVCAPPQLMRAAPFYAERENMDLTTKRYTVGRIDGDYAYLVSEENPQLGEKCVARALLPAEIGEGSRLRYEMLQYELMD